VPIIISAKGVERVIELDLTSAEKDAFMHSVESVKALVELCQRIAPEPRLGILVIVPITFSPAL